MARSGQSTARHDTDVLVVCTANVCRSPYVAALLRRHLPELTVAAAGTDPTRGVPLDPRIAPLLNSWGAPVRDVAGHRLTPKSVQRAHLILAATEPHRQRVIELDAPSAERVFTLKEFARLLAQEAPTARPTNASTELSAALHAAIAVAQARRGSTPERSDQVALNEHVGVDDLADPYGGSTADYRQMFTEVDTAVAVIVAALTEPRPSST